jgi:hypothetical protein
MIVFKETIFGWDMPKLKFIALMATVVILAYGNWFVLPLMLSILFDLVVDRVNTSPKIIKSADMATIAIMIGLVFNAIM